MFKKSLFALFSCLIMSGLFLIGSANAFEYTTSGNSKISFDTYNFGYVTSITYGGTTKNLSECNENGTFGTTCEFEHDSSSYTVNVTFNANGGNKMSFIHLDLGSNVIGINDYSGIPIKFLYLSNNKNINLNNKSASNVETIYINSGALKDFKLPLTTISNPSVIYFQHNDLSTIPTAIRDKRNYYNIKLSENAIYNGDSTNDRRIYLEDNPIKFVGITKVNGKEATSCGNSSPNACEFNNTSNLPFERFGYYSGTNITYKYSIIYDNSPIHTGTTNAGTTGVTITKVLKPGTYIFEVCIDGLDCNIFNNYNKAYFTINYDEDITIDDPDSSPDYSSLSIPGLRGRTGNYPKSLLSGYNYKITKYGDGNYAEGFISKSDTNSYCSSQTGCARIDIGSIIESKRSEQNGTYKLEIELIDKDGGIAKKKYGSNSFTDITASRDFTIEINNDFTITSPSDNQTIYDLPITFAWYTTGSSFNHFDYYITTGSSCNNSNIVTGGTKYTADVSFDESLRSGGYILCVEMSNGSNTIKKQVSFKVHKVPALEISSPNGTESQEYTTFTWQGSLPSNYNYINSNSVSYDYTIKKGSTTINSGTATGNGIIGTNISFSLPDSVLVDGSYSFNVVMHYTDHGTAHTIEKSVNFTRAISEHPYINIVKPGGNIVATGISQTGVSFQWNGGGTSLSYYKYSLKKSDSTTTITSGTVQKGSSTQFNYNLGNGNYIFTVTGYNSSHNPLTGASKSFSVTINSTLKITAPSNGTGLTAKSNIFTWTGFTPNGFTNYQYEIRKGGTLITGGSTNTISSNSRIVKNLRDGNDYTFKVTMNYNGGGPESDQISFKVSASSGAFLYITSPNQLIYTGNNIKKVPINFTWSGGKSALIENYRYKITNLNTNGQVTGGTVNKNVYAIPGTSYLLPSGRYKFEVTMLDDENKAIIDTGTYTFNVVIPSHLKINTPPAGQLTTKNVTFTWDGFAEFGDHYKYVINRVNPTTDQVISELTGNTNCSLSKTGFTINNIHNGKYIFNVYIMNSSNHEIISDSQTFRIPDDNDLIIDVSDGNTSITNTLRASTGVFTWGGKSEDFHGYYYSVTGVTFTGAHYSKVGTTIGSTTGEFSLNLPSGKYRFYVKMLNDNNEKIIDRYKDFNVEVPARLKITSPANGSTITSSSAMFTWTGYSDVITRYEYNLTKVGENLDQNNITTSTSFTRTNLTNGNYTLTVWISSGGSLVASDTVNFTVAIPVRTSGSSSKSHTTNNLNVSVSNDSPKTNERVEVVVDIEDKYTGKVDFIKMQVYSGGKWIDIPITSENYVSDYSDDAKLGYVRFSSDDDGEKELSNFVMFTQTGNYRLYAEDKDGYKDYTEFYIGNGKATTPVVQTDDDDYYIARSCKKYKIKRYDSLQVYSSPNLLMNEYFINKEYFKRYIDSKNRYQEGCPTNVGWISTSYYDKSNSNSRYTAPNGKVYFIVGKEGNYYSNELNKELKTPTSFNTIEQLKTYIKDRNPLINMAALGPVN